MGYVGIFILIFLGVLILQTVRQNLALGSIQLNPVPQRTGTRKMHKWAEENDFESTGSYTIDLLSGHYLITSYKHKFRPVFLTSTLETKTKATRWVDVVTFYEDGFALTTSSVNTRTQRGLPGAFKQCFPKKSFFVLWEKHQQAEQYLRNANLCEEAGKIDFKTRFEDYISSEARYRRRNPFFPLFAIFGICVLRPFWNNLPLQKQIERGWEMHPSKLYAMMQNNTQSSS